MPSLPRMSYLLWLLLTLVTTEMFLAFGEPTCTVIAFE
jgi:hypothetical protein